MLKTVAAGTNLPQSLAIDPNDGNKLLFSTPELDIVRSTDAGATWTTAATGFACVATSSVSIDPRTPSDVYLGTSNHGVLRSKDAGKTWSGFSSGLPSAPITTVLVDPVTAGRVHAGLDLAAASAGKIWRADSGSWVDDVGPTVAPLSIVADAKIGVLYAVGNDGTFYVDTAGWSSVTVASGCFVGAVAVDPSTGNNVYVTCNNLVYREATPAASRC